MRETFRIFAILLAIALGIFGAACAGDEVGEEKATPPVEASPPGDQADMEAVPSEEGDEEAGKKQE